VCVCVGGGGMSVFIGGKGEIMSKRRILPSFCLLPFPPPSVLPPPRSFSHLHLPHLPLVLRVGCGVLPGSSDGGSGRHEWG
jgi:hypothetical protein